MIAHASASDWYVNDGSQAGDVFTAAVGSDANPGTAALPFATVQFAINAAAAGDIIYIDAGSYTGDFIISKPLTIRGAKFGIPAGPLAIPPGRGTNESVIIGTIYFGAATDNITVDGLTIDRGAGLRGIEAKGLNSTIINNILTGIVSATTTQVGIATRANAVVRTHSYNISNNHVTGFRYGIYFDGGGENPSQFNYNYVAGSITAAFQLPASGGHQYKGNVMENNGQGMVFTKGNNTIEANTFRTSAGIALRLSGTPDLSRNDIINNFFENNFLGIGLTDPNAGAINNEAHYNSFTGNTANIASTHAAEFNATCNWFGTSDPALIAPTISGNVTWIPYLTNGVDADPALVGFQPQGPCSVTCNLDVTIDVVNVCPSGAANGSLTANVTGGASPTYSWLPGGQTTQTISGLSAGTYFVTVTDINGCTDTASATVGEENPVATITPANDTAICAGQSVILTASPGTAYLWNTQETTQSIQVSTTGTYSVTVTYPGGCTATSSGVNVMVNPLPVVTASDVSGCSGSAIPLSGSPAGGTFSVANPYTGPSTTYTYTYTDGNGCTNTSAPANITVTSCGCPSCASKRVSVCHVAGNRHITLCIPDSSVDAHLAHGDVCGPCAGSRPAASVFPNPFYSNATLQLSVPEDGYVRVQVTDPYGKIVKTIFTGNISSNRNYYFDFNAAGLAKGIYYYKVITSSQTLSGKMILLKE